MSSEYETAPYFIQFNSNCFEYQNRTIFGSAQVNSGEKHRNQQTITCQVLAEINRIWSCFIFIKLYHIPSPDIPIAIWRFIFQPQEQFTQVRFGGDAPPDLEQIRDRTLLVLKLYDKINPDTVSVFAHYCLYAVGLSQIFFPSQNLERAY